MGARAHVRIKDTNISLYTHWGSATLVKTVSRALSRQQRWNDPAYLARIIFCEMLKTENESLDGETGFGISNYDHTDSEVVIELDIKNQRVTIPAPYHIKTSFKQFSTFNNK